MMVMVQRRIKEFFWTKGQRQSIDGKGSKYEEEFPIGAVTGTYQEGYKNREMLNSEDGREAVLSGTRW